MLLLNEMLIAVVEYTFLYVKFEEWVTPSNPNFAFIVCYRLLLNFAYGLFITKLDTHLVGISSSHNNGKSDGIYKSNCFIATKLQWWFAAKGKV
jgi:hypothetical protein